MLGGDRDAGELAMGLVHESLRKVAHRRMQGERPGHLLETGALINEALIRIFGSRQLTIANRQHFFALACLSMRRVLIESGRRYHPVLAPLDEALAAAEATNGPLLADFEKRRNELRELDPDGLRVFDLRVGAGLTAEECAEELAVSLATVNRGMRRARTWLYKELRDYAPPAQ